MRTLPSSLRALVVVLLLLAIEVPSQAAFKDTDIHNASRRMTSLTEVMAKSHRQLLADWDPTNVFRLQTWVQGEIISGLPVFTGEVGNSTVESMNLLRAFTEAKIFFGELYPEKGKTSWSVALVAAGFAYGLNRPYSVVGGSAMPDGSSVGRGGGDAFGDQFMDAAYLGHGHVGPVKFRGGYLSSRSLTPTIGELDSEAERKTTGEWVTFKLEGAGLGAELRSSILPGQSVDFFHFDAKIMRALRVFGLEEPLRFAAIPGVELNLEFIQFQSPDLEGYDSSLSEERRGDDFLIGLKIEQSLWALFDDWRKDGEFSRDGVFEGGPIWFSAEFNYATKSNMVRDLVLQLGFETRGPEALKAGKRLSTAMVCGKNKKGEVVMTCGVHGRGGFSIFSDPKALPVVLDDASKTSVQGFDVELGISMEVYKYLVFDIDLRYRKNWAKDLIRVAEFADTNVFFFGLGVSGGI